MWIVFEKTNRRKLVTKTGITGHTTSLFAIEAIRRSVVHAWCIGSSNGSDIKTQQVGIADKRLCQLYVLLDATQTIDIKEQLLHQFNILIV